MDQLTGRVEVGGRRNTLKGVKNNNVKPHYDKLNRIGGKLTKLTKKQADYLGVPPEGPYKPAHS